MRCFKVECVPGLRRKPVEQLWRDHMLAGSMLLDTSAAWETGLYVFLYPADNEPCRRAAQLYQSYLSDVRSFAAVTIEEVVAAIESATDAMWIGQVRDRYLGWEKIDHLIDASRAATAAY